MQIKGYKWRLMLEIFQEKLCASDHQIIQCLSTLLDSAYVYPLVKTSLRISYIGWPFKSHILLDVVLQ